MLYISPNFLTFAGKILIMDTPNSQIDQFDRKILDIVSKDGRISVTQLASRVGLSKTPCQARLKRLQAQGYIQGFRAVLDPVKLGRDHVVFVEVKLTDTTETALSAFNAAVRNVAQVEQCHMIAGAFDYLLKVRTQDIKGYREILGEVISTLPFVASTSTHVSMETVKETMV